jgi:hypothetical protein
MPPITLIAYCLDKSGSMYSVKSDVIGATNSFMESQDPARDPEISQNPTYAGICSFSNHTHITWAKGTPECNYAFSSIAEFEPLTDKTYIPGGATALHDAVTATVTGCDQYIVDHPEQKVQVIIVIQTDGVENDSHVATSETVKALISARTEIGWTFTFLGANHDACLAAKKMGIHPNSALQYESTSHGSRQVSHTLSSAVSRMRSVNPETRSSAVEYTSLERKLVIS